MQRPGDMTALGRAYTGLELYAYYGRSYAPLYGREMSSMPADIKLTVLCCGGRPSLFVDVVVGDLLVGR